MVSWDLQLLQKIPTVTQIYTEKNSIKLLVEALETNVAKSTSLLCAQYIPNARLFAENVGVI